MTARKHCVPDPLSSAPSTKFQPSVVLGWSRQGASSIPLIDNGVSPSGKKVATAVGLRQVLGTPGVRLVFASADLSNPEFNT